MHGTGEQVGFERLAGWISGATVALALVAPAGAVAGGGGGPHFVQTEPQGAPTGERPAAIAQADFDGDGVLDVATANSRSNDVSVLLGDGSGFEPHARVAVRERPAGIAAGDLNGDGHADLAVANSLENDVSVLLGSGNGDFAAGPVVTVGDGPADIEIADVDGDGRRDFVTVNRRSADLTVVFGDGTGSAAAQVNLKTVISNCSGGGCIDPVSVVVAQLVGDAQLDVAVTEELGYVSIFRNDGARAFTQAPLVEAGSFPTHLTSADFNGDGLADLAAADSFNTLAAEVLLADGAGGFERVGTNGFQDNGQPSSIAAGDLDLDGDVDLAVTDDQKFLGLFLNRGDGTGFAGPRMSPIRGAAAASLADFTGDGRPDLAVVHDRAAEVVLLENRTSKPRPTPVKLELNRYDGRAFLGRVRSDNSECLRGRVQLYKERSGSDLYLGVDDGADRHGRFKLRYGGQLDGKYYAQLNHRRVLTGSCKGARSNRLRF